MVSPRILLVLPLLAPGCVRLTRVGKVFLSSDPQGAAVLVEGRDTGLSTPTWVQVGSTGSRSITLRREGYREETFAVGSDLEWEGTSLDAMRSFRYRGFPLPYILTTEDLFVPLRARTGPAPSHVHLKLLPQ